MVTKWGLSDKLGPLAYSKEEGEPFLGGRSTQQASMSADTADTIDDEIRALIDRNYQRATQILSDNMDILHSMSDALMKYETIDIGQIERLMKREEPGPPADWGDDPRGPKSPPSSGKPVSGDEDAGTADDDDSADKPVGGDPSPSLH